MIKALDTSIPKASGPETSWDLDLELLLSENKALQIFQMDVSDFHGFLCIYVHLYTCMMYVCKFRIVHIYIISRAHAPEWSFD